jgi:phosphoribosylamine--glycine ligase
MNVLLVGSGGREHALAWAMKKSPLLKKLFAAPGNPGIAELATCLPISVDDVAGLVKAAKDNAIDFVMVGPEGPLVLGLADALRKENIAVFGPNANAAQIEGSKGFMKDLCAKAGVNTAAYKRFTDVKEARAYAQKRGAPIVIKADGLAAGKGVTVAMNMDDALKAIDEAMVGAAFGDAGKELVIEEFMDGEEASFFAFIDGNNAVAFTNAQDHKRAFDGDKGPNTGGMGAYSPAPVVTADIHKQVMDEIIFPTARALVAAGAPFCGVLFAGLMITKTGPRLIEFNARFGDPETQAMLPRLKSDLLEALYKTATGKINDVKLEFKNDAALCVVMAANGYPGEYKKGTVITGVDKANGATNAVVFHAGTKMVEGKLTAHGGRVLGITGLGTTISAARDSAYAATALVNWPEGFYRKDLAARAAARSS